MESGERFQEEHGPNLFQTL